ncbi:MAG TPA: hypothetical protein VHC43_18230 [Mycobacteriales bacterium]|nr:hypothetical protein [Mycobacteriales bacterium]
MNYFDNAQGNLADSLAYYRDHRHELGTIIAAEVTFPGLSDHYPYCFELRDDQGNRMFLSGLAAGYPGEAPRAAMETLIDAGFPIAAAEQVLRDRQVLLHHPAWPTDRALPSPAQERATMSLALPAGQALSR